MVAIQDDSGVWLYDSEEIKAHAISFFVKLYFNEESKYHMYPVPNHFLRMDSNTMGNLFKPVHDEVIQ